MAEDILHILECPMCLEIYDSKRHRPKLLPCQHTLCAPCLDMVIKNNTIECPQCRFQLPVPSKGIEGLPNNLTMFALIDLQGKTNEQPNIAQTFDSPVAAQQTENLQIRQTISALISQLKGKVHTLSQTNVEEQKLEHSYQHAKGQIDSSLEKMVSEIRARKNILMSQVEAERKEGKHHLLMQSKQAQELLRSFQNEVQVLMSASQQPTKEDLEGIVEKCKNYLQHLHNLEMRGQGSWAWRYSEDSESKELLIQEISKFGQIFSNRSSMVAGNTITSLTTNQPPRPQNEFMNETDANILSGQSRHTISSQRSTEQLANRLQSSLSTDQSISPLSVGNPFSNSPNSIGSIGVTQSFDSGIDIRRRADSISSLSSVQSLPSFNQPNPSSQGSMHIPQLKPSLQTQTLPNSSNPFSRRTSAGPALNPVRGSATPPQILNRSASPLLRQQSAGAVGILAQSLPAQSVSARNDVHSVHISRTNSPTLSADASAFPASATSPAAFNYKLRGNPCKILGEGPSRGIKFSKPVALLSLPNTNLAVLDENYNSIAILTVEGQILKSYGTKGQNVGQFLSPKSFFLNKWNHFVVSDWGNNRVQIWDTGRDFIHQLGVAGNASQQLNGPIGVVSDRLENIYVCDSNNRCVKVFKADGTFLRQIGQAGDEDGKFQKPSHIAFTPGNQLMVTDSIKHVVQVFTPDGKFLYKFGGWGSEPGKLNSPTGIAVDPQGYVIVADTGNHRIQIFYASGTMETCFGIHGSEEGQFDEPTGIGFVRNGRFAVCDTGNKRIQVI
ncbi:tripartite motif-containing protein 2-like [Anneissia japonica]|uniref:tripartite motif-containing protein 2-like n=1 Tax=Anneissia japonica TaxID=1529436 RepID=UPI0014257957|nr:tripartite motif-containing protein 2-like [Anneissia japonica]